MQATEEHDNESWKLPLHSITNTLRIMDKLEQVKFIHFMRDCLNITDSKKRRDSLDFMNTLATWIKLRQGNTVHNTMNSDDKRFTLLTESFYVDCKSSEVSY